MNDEDYMRRALKLSLKGNPSPNPYVGAVLVKDGRITSEGYHRRAGMAHAEIEALKGKDAKGSTLYTTLEPCSHWGRTPPCTNAIIAAGVREVVYAVEDPTEKVKGKEELRAAGIKVRSGILRRECEKANEVFMKHSKTGVPFVVLKAAMTLDGQIATKTGQSRWMTGKAARKEVHRMRSKYDAVLVGANTVLKDDPRLTARIKGGRDPLRVILDGRLRIPLDAKVLKGRNVLIATTETAGRTKIKALEKKAEVLVCGKKRVDLEKLLRELGRRGITSVLVEGGAAVNYSFAKEGLVDKFVFFIAPKLLLGENTPAMRGPGLRKMAEATRLRIETIGKIGEDVKVEAYPKTD